MAVQQETTVPRHQRADAARNRERLLAAADEVFRERGLEAGVGEIAERAGIGRATLFRNFPTKQALIIAILADRMGAAVAEGRAMLAAADGDTEVLLPFIDHMVAGKQMNRGLFEAVAEDAFLTDPEICAVHAEMLDLTGAMVAHDQRHGFVREGIGAMDVLMLIKGVLAVACAMGDAGPEAVERHVSLIYAGIAAPGRECPLRGCTPTAPAGTPRVSD